MPTVNETLGLMPTTVVGSYPSDNVEDAVNIQANAGINYISTGQVCSIGKGMAGPFIEAMKAVNSKEFFGNIEPFITGEVSSKPKSQLSNIKPSRRSNKQYLY